MWVAKARFSYRCSWGQRSTIPVISGVNFQAGAESVGIGLTWYFERDTNDQIDTRRVSSPEREWVCMEP